MDSFITATGGIQFVSIRYTEHLTDVGIIGSVGSKGDSDDNAVAESFNGLYKIELIHRRGPLKNVDTVEWATLTYIDWCNNRRTHGEIGMQPPAEVGSTYYNHKPPVITTGTHRTKSL